MTYWGTNTYILGTETVAIIDPGPADDSHLDALIAAIAGRPVSHILVTHSHLDHSPLARVLSNRVDAPVLAFGDSAVGRSAVMAGLDDVGGGEGVDADFVPDVLVACGDTITGDGWSVKALHTPGHFGNHLCFVWNDAAFTGDHIMGWASSLVSPPDGDLTDFMDSCRALAKTSATRAYAGHGAPITDLQARIGALIAHRTSRETQIIDALRTSPATPAMLTEAIYTDVPQALFPMAERNVLAHLIDLTTRGHAAPIGPLSQAAKFELK
jgi:glyoxylase-like metal-dependent hydrolase (beta-lactamase superfamily II)